MRTRLEVIELVARSICSEVSPLRWENLPELHREEFRLQASVALTTFEELASDGGWEMAMPFSIQILWVGPGVKPADRTDLS